MSESLMSDYSSSLLSCYTSLPSFTLAYTIFHRRAKVNSNIYFRLHQNPDKMTRLDNRKEARLLIMHSMILPWNMMEDNSTLKIKKELINIATWMNFKGIVLTDRRKFQKIIYCMITFYDILEKPELQWQKLFSVCQRLDIERVYDFKGAVQRSFGG